MYNLFFIKTKKERYNMKKYKIIALFISLTFSSISYSQSENIHTNEYLIKAENGNSDYQYNLGSIYYLGKDYKKAKYWLDKSAEQNNPDAQRFLGQIYYLGDSVPKNYEKAKYWLEKSAEQGNVNAQYYLGMIYYNGEGVPKDYEKSKYWLNISCNNNFKESCKEYNKFNH